MRVGYLRVYIIYLDAKLFHYMCSGVGKEVISHYGTNMTTNKRWYTDANGREVKLRV